MSNLPGYKTLEKEKSLDAPPDYEAATNATETKAANSTNVPEGCAAILQAQHVILVRPGYLGPKPQTVICPSCQERITSRIDHKTNMRTHSIATFLGITLHCLCCVPYMMKSCKGFDHYSTNCDTYLGTFNN